MGLLLCGASPSAVRSWFARWAAHSPECLKRFLPDGPVFCSRRKLTIISCAQKLDMNITRIYSANREQGHKGMRKEWTQVIKEDRKVIAFLVLIFFVDCLVLVMDKYIKCIQY